MPNSQLFNSNNKSDPMSYPYRPHVVSIPAAMHQLNHPNLIKLYGIVLKPMTLSLVRDVEFDSSTPPPVRVVHTNEVLVLKDQLVLKPMIVSIGSLRDRLRRECGHTSIRLTTPFRSHREWRTWSQRDLFTEIWPLVMYHRT